VCLPWTRSAAPPPSANNSRNTAPRRPATPAIATSILRFASKASSHGAWRDRYRSVGQGEPVQGIGHNGNYFRFSLGPPVDPSGELPGGARFSDVRELKQCLVNDEEQLARNLVQQLAVYATGARIRFSDRPIIAKMLARSRASGYGVRTMVHELVQSDLFRNK
jgi:hypothetical protein